MSGPPVIQSLLYFALAAALEIGGCFAYWSWLRRGASAGWAVVGACSLVAFAVVLTRIDSPFAGRAYAAYGGVYIAASLLWLWVVEAQPPTLADGAGAALVMVGVLVILTFGLRSAG